MFLEKWCKVSKYKQWSLFLYISHSMEEAIASFQRGGKQWDFCMLLMLLFLWSFFWSFRNDASVVWISTTVSIDANCLLKLETFVIHFDEGKGTCIRSFEGSQLFTGKKWKTSVVKSQEFIKIIFFVSCHVIKLKVNGHCIGGHVYDWRKVSFFMSFFPFGVKRHYSCVP